MPFHVHKGKTVERNSVPGYKKILPRPLKTSTSECKKKLKTVSRRRSCQ